MPDRRIISASAQEDDIQFEVGLRPRTLEDFVGQSRLKENLSIAIKAALQREEAMDHVLLCGPPGLGKTTLAAIIAGELGVRFEQTSGPVYNQIIAKERPSADRVLEHQALSSPGPPHPHIANAPVRVTIPPLSKRFPPRRQSEWRRGAG